MDDLVFTIHDNLPREAPGSAACTRRALATVVGLSSRSRILDVGCGPGQQTIDLTRACDGRIVAVDLHGPYLRELERRAAAAGVADRVRVVRATMHQLPFADGSFDLIWSEGAIYIAGFERGLQQWRRLVRPRGCVAVTELCWLVDEPPDVPRAFWVEHYPSMTTNAGNLATAVANGYDVLDCFTLPESAWWDDYYGPLERRLVSLRGVVADADRAAIDSAQAEIDLYRAYSTAYGYVFFVLRCR